VLVARSHSLNRDLGLGSGGSQQASVEFWRHVQAGDAARGAHATDAAARQHYGAAYTIARQWVLALPDSEEWQFNLALVVTRQALLEEAAQGPDVARPLYASSLGIYQRLARDDQSRMQLAIARARLGNLELQAGRHEHAESHFRDAIKVHRLLSRAERHGPLWLVELSANLTSLAVAIEQQEAHAKRGAMGKVLLAAIAVDRLRVAQDPANIRAHHALALDHHELGRWFMANQVPDVVAARREFDASLRVASALIATPDPPLSDALAYITLQVGVSQAMSAYPGFQDEVQRTYLDVVRRLDALAANDPAADARRGELIEMHFSIAEGLRVFAKPDEATAQREFERIAAEGARTRYAKALALAEQGQDWAADIDAAARVARIRHAAGLLALEQGDPDTGRAHFLAAARAIETFLPDALDGLRPEYVSYYASIGEAQLQLGNCGDALARVRKAAELLDDSATAEERSIVQALVLRARDCR
jgi:tetratricopeptide (TPR) repeat protein